MANQQCRPNLLDVPISAFADAFKKFPEGVTTLRRIVSTSYYRQPIEYIRAEPDEGRQKEQKKKLRAFTPVAKLHHRKEGSSFKEKIANQWPLIMGDVDQKDNPNVDMATLKYHLCRLPFLLLCAYSVRGGLWFVMRLPDEQTPERLEAHFRYLQRLFSERFGIVLDPSKGSNPTHLRYVSYDAEPYFNEHATVMSGCYTAPKPTISRTNYGPSTAYDESQLLARLVRFVESAADGDRHISLRSAAITAGGYIATGQMDEQTAVYALETVASEWPDFRKSQNTIKDGIRFGLQKPL